MLSHVSLSKGDGRGLPLSVLPQLALNMLGPPVCSGLRAVLWSPWPWELPERLP